METHRQTPLPEDHRRRQRWEGVLILCAAIGIFLFAFSQSRLPQLSDHHSLASNVFFVLLINLNIILLVLLVFLVGRNLIKLFYERRRQLPGAQLRFRLVLAFVAIALLPAVLLLLVGVGFMTKSIENWFALQVEGSLGGALEVIDGFYGRLADNALFYAEEVAVEVGEEGLLEPEKHTALQSLIDEKQRMLHVDRVRVLSRTYRLLAEAPQRDGSDWGEAAIDINQLVRVFNKEPVRRIESDGRAEVVYGAAPVVSGNQVVGAVVAEYVVSPYIAQRSAEVADTFREYRHLKILKQPIKNNYTITMFLVTLVAVFSAIWIGLFLAKRITVPLQKLATATREVAQGHWPHRLEGEGEDEVGTLVSAFNRMTAELHQSHLEIEARRRYMEILLANINAGVVSLDRYGFLTTINRAAEHLLGIAVPKVIGEDYREVFASAEFEEVRRVVRELLPVQPRSLDEARQESQTQLRLDRDGQVLSLLVTGTPLTDDRREVLGVVCFFEDVTQIVRVERMEAWREVACRIAHEIKNPLTPIQLAAQRLQRRFAPQIEHNAEIFEECTHSIAQEVEAIKQLVNEFSTFARLPTADHVPQSLNGLAQEAIVLFGEAHRDLDFVFIPDPTLPPLELDREGIKRVLRNLLDNAVAACQAVTNGEPGRIEVITRFLRPVGIARLEVADTGCGIPPEMKNRLFEPYFSTKKEGTGLGLAIVATVVADHQGFIRVRDNKPQGSRFVIEFPVRRRAQHVAAAVETPLVAMTGTGGRG